MKPLVLLLASAAVSSLALAVIHAQPRKADQQKNNFRVELTITTPALSWLWDDANNALVTWSPYEKPQIATYNVVSGEKHVIDILGDFPSARFANVDGLAVASDSSVLVACDLGFPGANRAGDWDRLLLYDRNSALIRNLNAYPYDVAAVAMDEEDNIYMLGKRENEQSSEESYPLIVKYDSFGHVIQEMLSRSLFSEFDDPTGHGDLVPGVSLSFNGWDAALTVDNQAVRVYLPAVGAMIVLDHKGNIQRRLNVADKLFEFAQTNGYTGFSIGQSRFSPAGDLWIEGFLVEWNPSYRKDARDFIVRLTSAGEINAPYPQDIGDEPKHHIARLIGFTESDEPVAYSDGGSPNTVLIQKNPY